MAKTAKRRGVKGKAASSAELLAHPGTTAMLARVGSCNKPPILWRKQADGSWLECYLLPDCTYGNCDPVDASQVPASVRGAQ